MTHNTPEGTDRPRQHGSKALGYAIDADSLDQISPDEIPSVASEVGWALSDIKSRIRSAEVAREVNEFTTCGRRLRKEMHPEELAELHQQRSFLAGLHQQLLMLQGRYRRQQAERQQAAEAERAGAVPDLSHYFQQVVRNESSPTDYQRWVLQAEMRRSADLTRSRRKGAAAEGVGR